ncbi:DUF1344 domain-containing protein [Frigidibacter sp. ROC022]|uniref:DUF1344 domain-containing protein n=1 Tax=Frigidibacter sp. ROC022 TaxID=2971796 RepID=UPI00215B0FA2|nr:DUF1344 domain-containing protein [Frigidibacter sp. ROC022]MCR8723428.1 DUF1344 domain-containing protein [Frigidibacter sp. ROC022]
MRHHILPAALVVSTALSGAAFAATTTIGTVKAFDLAKHTLVLDDGTTYQLPAGFSDPGLKVGEKVKVVWEMKGTQHDASAVTIAE